MTGQFDRDNVRRAAETVLDLPGADGAEVVVTGTVTGTTRFARSEIIQNTARHELRAYVRVVSGGRAASASTNQLHPDFLTRAAQRALKAAKAMPPDPDFPGLPAPQEVGRANGLYRWDEDTAAADPKLRASAVGEILSLTSGSEAAGVYETGGYVYSVISSTGIDCHDAYTRCVVNCLVDSGESTGWGDASLPSIEGVDHERVARRALDLAERGRSAVTAAPGVREVVLAPSAVATLLEFLSYAGFGAKQVIDGESFLATRAGARVGHPSVTIADDAAHPSSVGIAFDFEGVPRRRVAVIDRGVATGPVTDFRTAHVLGSEPSGHGSGSNEFGPYASNLVLEPSTESSDALIAATDDGVLVTRLHYVNLLDRPTALLTGMTRDGTFRIRSGETAEPLHNFRFTNSVLDALEAVQGIGSDAESFAPEFGAFGSTVAPSLRIGKFRFSSVTTH